MLAAAIKQVKVEEYKQKNLEIIDSLQLLPAGDEMALFQEEMRAQAEAEAIEKLKKRYSLSRKKKPGKSHDIATKVKRTDVVKKKIKTVKKDTLKERLKLRDFSKWFSYKLGYSSSLANIAKSEMSREALKASVTFSPIKYLFFGATFSKDLNGYSNQYYQPDFSYSFGYSDWHPDTWSLVYSNYSDNKIAPKAGQDRFHFDEGTWELKYKTKIEKYNLSGALRYVPKGSKGDLVLTGSHMFENNILLSTNLKFYLNTNQQQLTLSGKKYLYKKFFVSGSLYLYAHLDKQTDLEPDYAYSFGWLNPGKGGISIVYSNYYTPTRWGWRDKKGPSFAQGTLSVSMNF